MWGVGPEGNAAGRDILVWAVQQLQDQIHQEQTSSVEKQAVLLALARYAQLAPDVIRRHLDVVAAYAEPPEEPGPFHSDEQKTASVPSSSWEPRTTPEKTPPTSPPRR